MPRRCPAPCTAAAALALVAGLAAADVPEYVEFELQARSNIVDGFNLPPGSSFNSGTIALNDSAAVAFRLIVDGSTGTAGLWYGGQGEGEVVYHSPPDPLLGDPDLNSEGLAAFEQYDFGGSDGVFLYDPVTGDTALAVPPGGPYAHLFFSGIEINDFRAFGFRGEDGGDRRGFYSDVAGIQTRYVAETSLDPNSPFAYLFTPSFNNLGQIAGKGRIGGLGGSNPDEIRRWEADGTSKLIAVDDDGDPNSPFSSFNNSVDLAHDGRVAFTAGLVGGGTGIFLSDGDDIVEIASTNHPDLSEIEYFAPAVNSSGLVAFRGKDGQGLQAIFVGDGMTLRRIIGEHDLIPTDLGTARIDQHDGSVVFGGGVDINENGDVGFAATLTPPDNNQVEWGTGMFVAYAESAVPGDIDGDGDVDQADLGALLAAYGACQGDANYNPDADFTGDDCIGQDDLGVLLSNWTG